MAVFSSKECPWTITGESACESFVDAPAVAKLGEYCDYKSCKEGSCIRLNPQSPNICTIVLPKDAKGCSKDNYVCDKDLKCNNDVCETQSTSQTISAGTQSKNEVTTTAATPTIELKQIDYDKLALYVFMGLIGFLILVMLILLFTRQ